MLDSVLPARSKPIALEVTDLFDARQKICFFPRSKQSKFPRRRFVFFPAAFLRRSPTVCDLHADAAARTGIVFETAIASCRDRFAAQT
jgi:hypothetical protein